MSSIYNGNYIATTYKEPASDYPIKLARHLLWERCYLQNQGPMIPDGGDVLDMGCGNGDITVAMQKCGYDAYGIDIGTAAKDRLPKGRFKQVDLQTQQYPFLDNTFDVVFSKSVVEHLHHPDHLINEAKRVLKPGGVIITMTPSWRHSYKEAFYIDHTHVTPFVKHSLSVLHELSGFENVNTEYFYQLPELWDGSESSWYMKPISRAVQFLGLPYRPFSDVSWSDKMNKFIRFSQEAMLLCVATKPTKL